MLSRRSVTLFNFKKCHRAAAAGAADDDANATPPTAAVVPPVAADAVDAKRGDLRLLLRSVLCLTDFSNLISVLRCPDVSCIRAY